MPGNLKEVRNRIKSVSNTQQITKAMKMVSAAKLRKAQDRILQMRPYSNKLKDMMANIVSGSDSDIVFAKKREVKNVLLVVVTSDRGLCGGFNSNLLKLSRRTIEEKYAVQAQAGNLSVMPVGKKSYDYFRRLNYKMVDDFWQLFSSLNFENSMAASKFLMDKFSDGTYDAIEIIYSQFKNASTQIFATENFLPVAPPAKDSSSKQVKTDFIFEPEKDELVDYLIPKILNTQFFKVLLDSNASEHGARMTAMDKASDNANEILKELRIMYNRARQAAITTELTEIVSGANALAGN